MAMHGKPKSVYAASKRQ